MMAASSAAVERIVQQQVYIRGANRPFGELTAEDARERADELKAATGWGPTARVATVAMAWRELTVTMERAGAATVADLGPEQVTELAPRLWVVLPG
jgi:hypothetical protein